MSNDSKITTQLAVDDPIVQDANYRWDSNQRQYVDNQIRGTQQHLVDLLISGKHATWYTLDGASVAVAAGDTVCLASTAFGTVTKSTVSALANAKSALGVVVQAAAPGGKVLVAFGGIVPPSITELAVGSAGFVRVNTTTGRCERVGSLATIDYGVGSVDASGWLMLSQYIGVSSGGVPSGSTGQIQFNDGGVFGGSPLLTFDKVTGALKIAGSTCSYGDLRLSDGAGKKITCALTVGGERDVISVDGSGYLTFGQNGGTNVTFYSAVGNFDTFVGTTFKAQGLSQFAYDTTGVKFGAPVVGNGTAWGALTSVGTQAMADANQTLASGVYQNAILKLTGANTARRVATVPAATDAQSYWKPIDNQCSGAFSVGISTGSGDSVDVANGMRDLVLVDSRGVMKLTSGANPSEFGLRLTLNSGTPVSATDQVGISTIYLTPFTSGRIALIYDGVWQNFDTEEISLALGTLTINKNYDVFAYWSGSAVVLELSAPWASDTVRTDAISRKNGVLVKSNSTTRRYVGTFRTTTTTTTEDSASNRYVFNHYNRVKRTMNAALASDQTQTTANAWLSLVTLNYVLGQPSGISVRSHCNIIKLTASGNMYARITSDTVSKASTTSSPRVVNDIASLSPSWGGSLDIGKHTVTLDMTANTNGVACNANTAATDQSAQLTIDIDC